MLTQYEGQLIRDQALLDNARIDQARYETLIKQNAIPEQQLATQIALVKQDEGTVKNDQGLIDSVKVNLIYCNITAPITGRIGLRLVDPGNIVQTTDTTGSWSSPSFSPSASYSPSPRINCPRCSRNRTPDRNCRWMPSIAT